MRLRRSLTLHLLAWSLGALLVVWGSFVYVGYRTGMHEADELTDGHLASVAALLLSQQVSEFATRGDPAGISGLNELKKHDYQQSLSVVVWDAQGQVLARLGQAPTPRFNRSEGFHSLQLGVPAVEWRSFSRWDASVQQKKVMVLLAERERDELAEDIAEQVTAPGLWLLPVIALVLGLAIHRGLRPLHALSREIHALDIHQLTPLHGRYPQLEIRTVVEAINMLIERYDAAMTHERQLASEMAHELRTPLASLTLHAGNLRGAASEAARETALAMIEAEARRAAQVIAELLALARADRSALAEATQPVDLAELSRQVLADHAQTAHDSGHELALNSPGPMLVDGHPLLLELALRNLVENALLHTPRGTQVEVQLNVQARWLQVCDNSAQRLRHPDSAPADQPAPSPGLGLGHRVVEKIAKVHRASFEQVSAPPGFSTCFRLTFP